MRFQKYLTSYGIDVDAPSYPIAVARTARLALRSPKANGDGASEVEGAARKVRDLLVRHWTELNGLSMNRGHVRYWSEVYRPADQVDPSGICDALRCLYEAAGTSPPRMEVARFHDPRTRRQFLDEKASLELTRDLVSLHPDTLIEMMSRESRDEEFPDESEQRHIPCLM